MTPRPLSRADRLGPDAETGVSLRLAGARDIHLLRRMYTEFLTSLVPYHPVVDVNNPLQRDWVEKPSDLFPWIIELEGETPSEVGFAFVCGERYAHALRSPTDFVLYEFLVTERVRRSGIGRSALELLLTAHPGLWSLDVLQGNEPALAFWACVLAPHHSRTREHVDDDGVTLLRHVFRSTGKES